MKTKEERLSEIRNIVLTLDVSNQEELLNLLNKRGFNTTQATLSRDIKRLKIIKSPDINGNYIYSLPGERNHRNNFSDIQNNELAVKGFVSIEFSNNLAVLKTRPGYAMGIASDIDKQVSYEIIGTIAGDDTILIIPREDVSRKDIITVLSEIIPGISI